MAMMQVRSDDSTTEDTSATSSTASTDTSSTSTDNSTSSSSIFKIDHIEPDSGPITGKFSFPQLYSGETRVLVRGGPFSGMNLTYPKPMCKFGHDDMVVEATYVLCTASTITIFEKEARHKDKDDTCLQCDNSPSISKDGLISFTISMSGDFSDVINSVSYRYYNPTRIWAIYPHYGPKDGETIVQIWGDNFLNFGDATRCAFGTKTVKATFINSNYMICESPFSDVVEKAIPFTVSLNNQQNSKDDVSYYYYSWPAITDLIPDRGPDAGGTKVLLRGRNFFPFKDIMVDNSNDTFCKFENLAKVPAKVINSTKAICYSPPSYILRSSIVEITLNNQQYTDDNNVFYYYRPPYLFDISPRMGPIQGGTKVIAIGSNFRDTGNITCMFNETVVQGKYLSTSEIECISPAADKPGYIPLSVSLEMDMYSHPIQFLYYERPVIDDIYPKCGPDYGYTQITVVGKNFLDMGHNKALCAFNKTIFTNATIMDDKTMKCDSPSLINSQGYSIMKDSMVFYYVTISIDGGSERNGPRYKFTYYKDPKLTNISPFSGPTKGGTTVRIDGSGFAQEGACNRTVRVAVNEVKPFYNGTGGAGTTVPSGTTTGTTETTGTTTGGTGTTTEGNGTTTEETGTTTEGTGTTTEGTGTTTEGTTTTNGTTTGTTTGGTTTGGTTTSGTTTSGTGKETGTGNETTGNGTTSGKGTSTGGTSTTTGGTSVTVSVEEGAEGNATVDDTKIWFTAPPVKIPDETVVAVALNGQQFTKDWIIHVRDDENTYIYYVEPIVTNFCPRTGPSIGGTRLKLDGYGFMPRKNKDGEADHDRNQMYIRFVDPETYEVLSPSTMVDEDDLSDDTAEWYTPALSADTKALMQVSLNDQDWTSVPQPNKTYSFAYYESPHITKLHPSFGKVKAVKQQYMEIEGTGFVCTDTNCTNLYVRFGEPPTSKSGKGSIGSQILVKGTLINDTHIRCPIPKYTKPDVLRVEITFNDVDYTNDKHTYGYYDPYVLNAEPRLISTDGTTKVRIKGFGFVNSNQTKGQFDNPNKHIQCDKGDCIKDAEYIDKDTLEVGTYPQTSVTYESDGSNVLWDPITINAAVYENDFTENNVELYYYEEPEYSQLTQDETPANEPTDIFIKANFKSNPLDRFRKYSNFTCRYISADGKVMYTKAKMIKYPIDSGDEDHVTCATPRWNLTENKTSEQVKLDIAVNGQDFHGGFDFTFTAYLIIHRTIPMAGPVQGNSKTRIIGQGWKPTKSYVNLKWGVINTTTIWKEQVTDYVYYKTQFENMIEGSEELKAYIYEAANFPRVDTVLYESYTYHSYFLQSYEMWNWTKTHGGPYYLEVGKNLSVKYMSHEFTKITYSNGSHIQPNQVEKNWTFYDYDPSSVEYYFYKDCIIKAMQPHSGVLAGGTLVQVIGAWFKYMPEYGVVPHCKFGDKIVRAQFDSTVRIVCAAPPTTSESIGVEQAFEVSLNGMDWSNSGLQFTYYEQPTLDSISPDSGPESGGTPIYIYGVNFTNMSSATEFNCKFTPISLPIPPKTMPAIYLNSTTIMCASPGGWGKGDAMKLQVTFNGGDYDNNNFTFTFFAISRMYPKSGPSDGTGGSIIIEGQGFKNESNPLCKINNTIYKATQVTWNKIYCPMPRAIDGEQYFGNVAFSVAPNGKDWNNFVGGFQYYPQPIVTDIYPKQGPNQGLGVINFYGDNFRDDYNAVELGCKIGDSIGKAIYVSSKQLRCVVEDMELTQEGEYLPAQVALNSYSWTTLNNNTFYLPYGVEDIQPNGGPSTGVTHVFISGKGFVDEEGGTARCRFGTPANYAIVEAQIISYDKIVCTAPSDFALTSPAAFPHDVPLAIALTSDEYDPWTETYHKFRIYQQPIPIRSDPTEVDVGTIQEVLVWADDSTVFFDPVPINSKSSSSDSDIAGPSVSGGIMCSFGRFGQTQGIYINETVIKCVTPAVEDDPDSIYRETVKLAVAMNGIDYDEESTQVEFTFVGTGTYLVFWPFIIGALLIGLLIVALVVCCATLFQKMSMEDMLAGKGANAESQAHVFNLGNGAIVPRGRSDWHAERSSLNVLEKASGVQLY